jgi:hypothetical protein
MRNIKPRHVYGPILLLAIILVSLTQSTPASAAPERQTNIVQNPGFEEPYSGGTAQSWSPWHQELNSNPKPANCSERYLVRPTWAPELASAGLILEGARSQHVGNSFDTWRAGVMQTISVNPGSTYRFTFWSTGRSTNDQYPAPSDASVNLGVRGGIDPNGSGLWSDADIVWGAAGSPHMSGSQGNWQQFSVEATASGSQITVFVQGDNGGSNQCRKHLDVWFDNAQVIEVGPPPTNTPPPPPPPPPQPVVTNTPIPPTATATPEVSPTNTPVPSATPTKTPEPPETGAICANAFADANLNGQRDPDEGFMAGVSFTVVQEGVVFGPGVSTGTDIAVCFEDLETGAYLVAQEVPRGLVMTTAQSATVEVNQGSTVTLEFGSWFRSDTEDEIAALTPTVIGGGSSSSGGALGNDGVSILAIVGLGAILLAILLLGALIIILVRQSRKSAS